MKKIFLMAVFLLVSGSSFYGAEKFPSWFDFQIADLEGHKVRMVKSFNLSLVQDLVYQPTAEEQAAAKEGFLESGTPEEKEAQRVKVQRAKGIVDKFNKESKCFQEVQLFLSGDENSRGSFLFDCKGIDEKTLSQQDSSNERQKIIQWNTCLFNLLTEKKDRYCQSGEYVLNQLRMFLHALQSYENFLYVWDFEKNKKTVVVSQSIKDQIAELEKIKQAFYDSLTVVKQKRYSYGQEFRLNFITKEYPLRLRDWQRDLDFGDGASFAKMKRAYLLAVKSIHPDKASTDLTPKQVEILNRLYYPTKGLPVKELLEEPFKIIGAIYGEISNKEDLPVAYTNDYEAIKNSLWLYYMKKVANSFSDSDIDLLLQSLGDGTLTLEGVPNMDKQTVVVNQGQKINIHHDVTMEVYEKLGFSGGLNDLIKKCIYLPPLMRFVVENLPSSESSFLVQAQKIKEFFEKLEELLLNYEEFPESSSSSNVPPAPPTLREKTETLLATSFSDLSKKDAAALAYARGKALSQIADIDDKKMAVDRAYKILQSWKQHAGLVKNEQILAWIKEYIAVLEGIVGDYKPLTFEEKTAALVNTSQQQLQTKLGGVSPNDFRALREIQDIASPTGGIAALKNQTMILGNAQTSVSNWESKLVVDVNGDAQLLYDPIIEWAKEYIKILKAYIANYKPAPPSSPQSGAPQTFKEKTEGFLSQSFGFLGAGNKKALDYARRSALSQITDIDDKKMTVDEAYKILQEWNYYIASVLTNQLIINWAKEYVAVLKSYVGNYKPAPPSPPKGRAPQAVSQELMRLQDTLMVLAG